MGRFDNKTALVTAGGRGIGKSCALRLASEGARIAVADVDTAAANAAVAEIEANDGDAIAVTGDVTDTESMSAMARTVVDTFGGIDVLVNGVGIAGSVPFEELDDAEWDRQVDPTLRGTVRCVQACLPHLLEAPGGGAVVSIGSVNGLMAIGGVAYSAAKAALGNVTANFAASYGRAMRQAHDAERGWARFNLVAPGTIRTRAWENRDDVLEQLRDVYPAGRVGEPEDIAAAVAFLASPEADWITGVTLPVDGGLTTSSFALTWKRSTSAQE